MNQESRGKTLFTEKEFRAPLDTALLQGTIDRIDESPEGNISIVEYKTYARTWTKERIQDDLQMTLYQMGCEEGLGLEPSSCKYFFLSTGDVVETKRTREQVSAAKEKAQGCS